MGAGAMHLALSMVQSALFLLLLFLTLIFGFVVTWKYILPGNRPPKMRYDSASKTWLIYRYDDAVALMKQDQTITGNIVPALMNRISKQKRRQLGYLREFLLRWPSFEEEESKKKFILFTLGASFGKANERAFEQVVNSVLTEILDELATRTEWDAVRDLARPVPILVMMRMLGFPSEDMPQLCEWVDIFWWWFEGKGETTKVSSSCQSAMQDFTAYVDSKIDQIAKQKDDDEFKSILHQMMRNERIGTMDRDDLAPVTFYLLVIAHETTTALIANSLMMLMDHVSCSAAGRRALQTQLREDPAKVNVFVEEVVRHASPVSRAYRRVRTDAPPSFRFKDSLLRPDEVLCFVNAAANRDKKHHGAAADAFQMDRRSPCKPVQNGLGAQLGLRLAKVMTRRVLQMIFCEDRFPRAAISVREDEIKPAKSDTINLVQALPITNNPVYEPRMSMYGPKDHQTKTE